MLNNEQKPEVCDAMNFNSSNVVGYIQNGIIKFGGIIL